MFKRMVWATYGDPNQSTETLDGKTLTKENARDYASSLLRHSYSDFTGNGLETKTYKITSVTVVEDAHEPEVGYIVVEATEIPEIVCEHSWNGHYQIIRTWDPRAKAENLVTISNPVNETELVFHVANQEDADVVFQALKRVRSVVIAEEDTHA